MIKTILLAHHTETEHSAFAARSDDAKIGATHRGPSSRRSSPHCLIEDLRRPIAVGRRRRRKALPVKVQRSRGSSFTQLSVRMAGGTGNAAPQAFSLGDGRTAVFQLVFHPLQEFEHPFQAARLITRLWPEPPTNSIWLPARFSTRTPTARQ